MYPQIGRLEKRWEGEWGVKLDSDRRRAFWGRRTCATSRPVLGITMLPIRSYGMRGGLPPAREITRGIFYRLITPHLPAVFIHPKAKMGHKRHPIVLANSYPIIRLYTVRLSINQRRQVPLPLSDPPDVSITFPHFGKP